MRYYKTIIFFLLTFSFDSIAQPGIGSAKSLIKIEFEDVYGLQITHPDVNLEINSIEKFTYGTQTNWLNSHLIITGTKNFEISIKTLQANFMSNNLETNVNVSNINVNARINTKSNSIFLSDNSQILIKENNGSLINYIDVNYKILPEHTFAFINSPTNTFETLIVYTLIPN